MKRHLGGMVAAAVLALGLWFLGTAGSRGDEKEDIQKIADKIAKGESVGDKEAEDISKGDLDAVMHLFKPPAKKGLPILGPKGIELGLGDLAKKGQGGKQKEDVVKAASVIQAVAQVTKHYANKDPGSKAPDKWKKYTDEMQKSGKDLQKAAEAGDNDGIKKAAGNVQASCTNCHTDFRD